MKSQLVTRGSKCTALLLPAEIKQTCSYIHIGDTYFHSKYLYICITLIFYSLTNSSMTIIL